MIWLYLVAGICLYIWIGMGWLQALRYINKDAGTLLRCLFLIAAWMPMLLVLAFVGDADMEFGDDDPPDER